MKSSDLKQAIKACNDARLPFFMWGPPGVGKSDTVRQVGQEIAEETGQPFEVRDVRATLLDPVDMRGLPTPAGDGRVKWLLPDFLPTEGSGLLFLDELNSAPPATQAACYQLVLDRRIGDYVLPDGWMACAAGNRETDRGVSHRMPSPLSNRFLHLDFDVNTDDWVKWALAADVATEVLAFIRFRPALLHQFDPTKNEKAFPTPRSWKFVSDIIKNRPASAGVEYEMIKGTVGEGAAAEFVGFLKIYRNLPNPDGVLMSPATAMVPDMKTEDGPATLWALCGALSRKASEQTMPNMVTYANRLPDEFSVLLIRDCEQHCPEVRNTRAYIQWASDHADVLV